MKSIYVSIPSIPDSELENTVNRCFENSSGESEVRVGIGLLGHKNYLSDFGKNVNTYFLDRNKYAGIGIARRHSLDFYEGEDYYLQIDSHTLFKKNWDIKLINLLDTINGGGKKLLSCYPPEYSYINYNTPMCDNWGRKYTSKFSNNSLIERLPHGPGCAACEEFSLMPSWDEHLVNNNKGEYISNPKLSGGFVFADKSFAENYYKLLPYDYSFFDDEIVMSIESYNLGWTFYCPPGELPIAHLYGEDINIFGGERSALIEDEVIKLNVKQNYINYVLDPNNKNKIESFEKYANVDILNRAKSEN